MIAGRAISLRDPLLVANPFRLAGLPSGTPYKELLRKANEVVKRSAVGLPNSIPLSDRISSEAFEDLISHVRSLASNSTLRTTYRLAWPLTEKTVTLLVTGGNVGRRELPSYVLAQVLFLEHWIEFMTDRSVSDLHEALVQCERVVNDEECGVFLAGLLMSEEGYSQDFAMDQVCASGEVFCKNVLSQALFVAVQDWHEGRDTSTISILREVVEGPLSEWLDPSLLRPIVEMGDALEAETKSVLNSIPSGRWQVPECCLRLNLILDVMHGHHPSTSSWRATANECVARSQTGPAASGGVGNFVAKGAAAAAGASSHSPPRQAARSTGLPYGCLFYVGLALIGGISKSCGGGDTSSATTSSNGGAPYVSPSVLPSNLPPAPSLTESQHRRADSNDGNKQADQRPEAKMVIPIPKVRPPDVTVTINEPPASKATPSVDPYRAALQQEYDALKVSIQSMRVDIKSLEGQQETDSQAIELERSQLLDLKSDIDRTPPDTTNPYEVDLYNQKVDEYNSKKSTFNEHVDLHNSQLADLRSKLNDLNAKIDRLNSIASQLNRMRD